MASIFGFSIKNITTFMGREGQGSQGNIYYNNKKVGWYNGKPVKMYAEDGRTKTVGANDVAANEKVGWYTEPVQKLYTADGTSKLFKKSQVAAQLKVGCIE